MNVIALILARSGSKGLKNKNIKRLRGYNLIQWSVFSALESSFVKKIIINLWKIKFPINFLNPVGIVLISL